MRIVAPLGQNQEECLAESQQNAKKIHKCQMRLNRTIEGTSRDGPICKLLAHKRSGFQ